MFNALIQIDEYDGHKLPKVGIRSNGKEYLALMHQVQEYKNAFGEDRYLVLVEKRDIDKIEHEFRNGKWVKTQSTYYGFSNTCNACYAKIDLKIFKKINDGRFELISTSQNDYQSTGGTGVADLDISNLKSKIQKVGETKVGFFYTSSSFHTGLETTSLSLLVLDENQIKDFFIGIVGSDDSGKYFDESPLSHTLTGSFKVLEDSQVGGYYPIEIKFKGDTYDMELQRIVDYNKIDLYEFSPKEDQFKLKSSKDY